MRLLLARLLHLGPERSRFTASLRGCPPGPVRDCMERAGGLFVEGYEAACREPRPEPLAARLDLLPPEVRGFAYEGAGLGLALLDALPGPRRGRLAAFLAGPGSAHTYIVHVGAGWLLARRQLSPTKLTARLDPLLGWLAFNGFGFHQGFFHTARTVVRQEVPRRLDGPAARAFDQGIGRSLWFGRDGAAAIGEAVARFPSGRRGDLWSGVGEACAYAGGRERTEIAALRTAAGPFAAQLAQGAAFAAEVRDRARAPARHTDLACKVLCGTSPEEAAAVVRAARLDLPEPAEGSGTSAFEVWRERIQSCFPVLAGMVLP